MTSQQKHHFHSIDLLRGMAALIVAFYHYTNFFLPETNLFNFICARGYLGVEAFFVISGLVVPYSMAQKKYSLRHIGRQFVSRAIRIEPAYWASIVMMLLIDASMWYPYPKKWLYSLDFYNLGLHLVHANAIMHQSWVRAIYWTLAIDWQFYIFALLTFPLMNRREWWIRYVFYAFFAFRFWSTPYELLPYHASSFGVGFMLFHYYMGYMGRKELLLVLSAFLYIHFHDIEWQIGVATILPGAIIYFINAEWSWAKFIGKMSYSFYLTHIGSGWMLLHGATKYYKDNHWVMGAMVFVAVGFSMLFAKFFYDWVEEPTLNWVKKWQKWSNKRFG